MWLHRLRKNSCFGRARLYLRKKSLSLHFGGSVGLVAQRFRAVSRMLQNKKKPCHSERSEEPPYFALVFSAALHFLESCPSFGAPYEKRSQYEGRGDRSLLWNNRQQKLIRLEQISCRCRASRRPHGRFFSRKMALLDQFHFTATGDLLQSCAHRHPPAQCRQHKQAQHKRGWRTPPKLSCSPHSSLQGSYLRLKLHNGALSCIVLSLALPASAQLPPETPAEPPLSVSQPPLPNAQDVPQVPGLSDPLHGWNAGLTISGVH